LLFYPMVPGRAPAHGLDTEIHHSVGERACCAALIALGLGACASGHWVKPQADLQAFSADGERCTLEAWQATPQPELYGPPCNADGSYMNCSTRASEGAARTRPRTQSEVMAQVERDNARRGTYGRCMSHLGWHWEGAQ